MAATLVEFTFQFGERGWKEEYYKVNGLEVPEIDDDIKRLALLRARCLGGPPVDLALAPIGDQPRLVGIHVSNVETHVGRPWVTNDGIQNANATKKPASFGESVLNIRLNSTSGKYHRYVKLRAVPDLFIPQTAAVNPSSPLGSNDFRTQVQAFMDELAPGGNAVSKWGMKAQSKEVLQVPESIVGVRKHETNLRYIIKTEVQGTFTEGQRVLIKGVRGKHAKGLNGIHLVTAYNPDEGEYTIDVTACNTCIPDLSNFGTVQAVVDHYEEFATAAFGDWGNVKVGNGTTSTRGRRRARCK